MGNSPEEIQYNLMNPEIEQSLVSMLPTSMQEAIERAKFEKPHLFGVDEATLRDLIKAEYGRQPNTLENQLRLRLWYEYDITVAQKQNYIQMNRIYSGICAANTFLNVVERNAGASWLMCMPMSYENHMDELLNFGASKMRDIMKMDATDPLTKKVNVKLLQLQTQIYLAAELRRYGGITQVTKNLNYNAYGGLPPVNAQTTPTTDLELQKKIDLLRRKDVKDVTPKKEDIIDV